ncbi:MAG: hypothetical protein JXX29_08395 [Deltaproteobacteria bacterium]|nr:hypothetical protein [Deltaproteobacteria bacterium]MBN2671680.1 hypothetical protein [Deltaproteobacteria bacterium]
MSRSEHEVKVVGDIDVSGFPVPVKRLNIIVGSFGSGKTEISVNWTAALARFGHRVKLADLDMANPYFRSREAQQFLREQGVVPVVPHGEVQFSDLPVLVPQIKGMLQRADDDFSFFDVGGDETGAKVLASLRSAIGDAPYMLYQVINERRPFTGTVAGCLEMKSRIETVAGLTVGAYINNTHLMEYTDESIVRAGMALCEQLVHQSKVPVAFTTVMEGVTDTTKLKNASDYPICVLNRRMLPPWLNHDAQNSWPIAAADRRG